MHQIQIDVHQHEDDIVVGKRRLVALIKAHENTFRSIWTHVWPLRVVVEVTVFVMVVARMLEVFVVVVGVVVVVVTVL